MIHGQVEIVFDGTGLQGKHTTSAVIILLSAYMRYVNPNKCS